MKRFYQHPIIGLLCTADGETYRDFRGYTYIKPTRIFPLEPEAELRGVSRGDLIRCDKDVLEVWDFALLGGMSYFFAVRTDGKWFYVNIDSAFERVEIQ